MGEATAKQLLELGAEVHGLDYKETSLELASFTQVDLRDPQAIDAAVAGIGGKVDALFNCAGLPQTAAPLDVMKVNYLGARRVTEQVLPLMSDGGAIVSISSTAGMGWSRKIPQLMELIQADGYDAAVKWCEDNAELVSNGYTLSKEVLIVWTMLASSSLIQQNIRINCTLPAPTETPMMEHFEAASGADVVDLFIQPINRRSTPEEQASPLIFLNSDAARYVNGVVLPVDGGFMGGVATGQVDLSSLAPSGK
jgi:NAD(P)-dependent dehydrogenase (short-subunit alcohol dehydrogenase family)